jgi:tRNA(adenine34) deaminase
MSFSMPVTFLVAAFWIFVIQEIQTTVSFIRPSTSRAIRTASQMSSRLSSSKIETEFDSDSTMASGNYAMSIDANTTERHYRFMDLALQQARKAAKRQEVPIGAIVVQHAWDDRTGKITYKILSQAGNSMESTNDASAHAELLALRRAAKRLHNWRLLNTTLYSTVEPCPMCLAAAQAFRVSEIVYGAPDLRLGAIETYMKMLDDYQHPIHVIDRVVPGVLKNESSEMMKSFFRQRRLEKSQKNGRHETETSLGRLERWKHRLQRMISRKR